MKRRFRKMKSAPKDRNIILKIRHGFDGKKVAVMGCWMAPNGNPALEGWWAASSVTGSCSYEGMPFKIDAASVTPKGWMDLPIRSRSWKS